MLKKFSWLMVAMLAASLMAGGTAFAEKEYVNGIDANFPPFAYVDKNGAPGGFDVDAVNWMAEKLGFKVKHQPMEWSGIVASLQMKKIDFIASGLSITEERAKKIDYTIPYWSIKQVFVVKKDAILTVDEIKAGGKVLGVQSGTSEAKWLKKQIENGRYNLELRMYDSAPLAVEDVLNGRIAAAAMDDAPAFDATRKKPVKVLGTFGMPPENFGYGVHKADKELKELLNKGLKMLMADPYWKELIEKYKPGELGG
ncbi:MAG: amino acid ABC transporter substrate-binding protein [Desulfobacterales bacterium]|nr:amino acid ABC transporter substrate-binding protein [Desulfobacterales bacterium]